MYLEELIQILEACPDKGKIVPWGFSNPHSWRGDYSQLAFEPVENISVREMLNAARSALGATYQGYKGGDYTMGRYTDVYICDKGEAEDQTGVLLLKYMLGEED